MRWHKQTIIITRVKTLNEKKVCVSISKDSENVSKRILENVQVLDMIQDKTFETIIISRSDFEKLTSQDFWKKDAKSVILTSSYFCENKEVFVSPYLYVKLKKEEDMDLLTLYAERYKLKIVRNSPLMPLWYVLAVTQDSGKNVLECVNELWESGQFAASEPDLCSKNLTYSNDPFFYQQWGLHNSNNTDIDINVTSIWTHPRWNYFTGKNIKIAIIDKGVVLTHKDLVSNISNLSYDTETESSPSDIYGDHGTHCAGIAAAIKDNGIHIAGVAPEAKIVSISNELEFKYQNSFKLANGITWAYEHGVDIISCSWGAVYNSILNDAIQNAFTYGRHGKGCVVVFAAGNRVNSDESMNVAYPANCNDMILAVGSVDNTGVRAPNSKFGAELDLVAPGVNILSTLPDDTIGYKSGTSMACPHVAGVAALVLQRNSELTASQVNSIICSNTKKIPSENDYTETKPDGSWNNEYGYGLVDAYNSVTSTPDAVYIQNDTITGTRVISGEKIYVGKNVTNTKAYGDVILGQGDITLQARYLKIKNSTTVPLGTTLAIESY